MTELFEQGQTLQRQDRAAALAWFERTFRDVQTARDEDLAAIAALELALELLKTGNRRDLTRATDLANQVVGMGVTTPTARGLLHFTRGAIALAQFQFEQALASFQDAEPFFANDPDRLCLVEEASAICCRHLGNPTAALARLEQSLARRRACSSAFIAATYIGLAQHYLQVRNLEAASDYFEQALDASLEQDDKYTRIAAMAGLSQLAIASQDWEIAAANIQDTLQLVGAPEETNLVANLYKDLAEVLLGTMQLVAAQACLDEEVIPRFESLEDNRGLALAKQLKGRALSRRLIDGVDSLSIDTLELAEEPLLEACMYFDQLGLRREYAIALYDLSCLYLVGIDSEHRYQFTGKATRSLEMAVHVLDESDPTARDLIAQIESLQNELIGGRLV